MDYLYHGSINLLQGEHLIPRKAKDIRDIKANTQIGIYATDVRNSAIAMAILHSPGVNGSRLLKSYGDEPCAIIFEGWPDEKLEIFLYKLPKDTFKPTPPIEHQFISYVPVKPIEVEQLRVKDYLHLIRRPTYAELSEWQLLKERQRSQKLDSNKLFREQPKIKYKPKIK